MRCFEFESVAVPLAEICQTSFNENLLPTDWKLEDAIPK